jgi:hypothetical protein
MAMERAASLMESGHSYWHVLVQVALLVGAMGLLLELGSARASARASLGVRRRFLSSWLILAVCQTGACFALEVIERIPAGHVGALFHDPILAWVVPTQCIVALAAAALLKLAERLGLSLARRSPGPTRHRNAGKWDIARLRIAISNPAATATRTRAPPLCLSTN